MTYLSAVILPEELHPLSDGTHVLVCSGKKTRLHTSFSTTYILCGNQTMNYRSVSRDASASEAREKKRINELPNQPLHLDICKPSTVKYSARDTNSTHVRPQHRSQRMR